MLGHSGDQMNRKIRNFFAEKATTAFIPAMHRLAIGQVFERLMRIRLLDRRLESEYRDMARDDGREAEALEWIEVMIGDVDGQPG